MPILTPSNFINEDDASQYAQSLKNQYPDDIDKEKLTEEFQLFYKFSDKFKTWETMELFSQPLMY